MDATSKGQLALVAGFNLNLQVLGSRRGFYIGTQTPEGHPCSRESTEYWKNQAQATAALTSGDWTQRSEP